MFVPKKTKKIMRPDNVNIKNWGQVMLPGAMAGQAITAIFGLGTDNKLYEWSSDAEEWILNTNQKEG